MRHLNRNFAAAIDCINTVLDAGMLYWFLTNMLYCFLTNMLYCFLKCPNSQLGVDNLAANYANYANYANFKKRKI
jgi:hypothetical protein